MYMIVFILVGWNIIKNQYQGTYSLFNTLFQSYSFVKK